MLTKVFNFLIYYLLNYFNLKSQLFILFIIISKYEKTQNVERLHMLSILPEDFDNLVRINMGKIFIVTLLMQLHKSD